MKEFIYKPTERDVIDALLKISEIIQKAEANKLPKRSVGNGDCTYHDEQVPIPPPMRTLDSYISEFNRSTVQKASNCNQISSRKRFCCDSSSNSSIDERRRRKVFVQTDDEKNHSVSVDDQLQITLEKYLKKQLLSSDNEQIRQVHLSNSETEKLLNGLNPPKSIDDVQYYDKQRELALLAAKEGNYSLSYSIYTNLLHNSQYDHKMKSNILSSRATVLLLDHKSFESVIDCTQAIAYNQWNKLAYIIRGACWMIQHEYTQAIDDYSKLFHFFDQSQYVLDLLNLAYKKSQLLTSIHS